MLRCGLFALVVGVWASAVGLGCGAGPGTPRTRSDTMPRTTEGASADASNDGPAEDDVSSEVAGFLERFDAIDLGMPERERRLAIESLRSWPLTDASVEATRGVCVSAHLTLLDAETHHEAARAELRAAAVDSEIPRALADRIQAMIAASNEEIARATELFETCRRERSALRMRFGLEAPRE